VTFDAGIAPAFPNVVRVVASEAGLLHAFIDFGTDGSFDDPGDRIFDSLPLVAGENVLTFPTSPTPSGETYGRFRISSAGGLGPTGFAPDGEVEDYVVVIGAPAISCQGGWENLTFGSNGLFGLEVALNGLDGTATITVGGNVFGGSGGTVEAPLSLNLLTGAITITGDLGFLGEANLVVGLDGSITGTLTAPTAIPAGIITLENPVVALPEITVDVQIDFDGGGTNLAFSRITMNCAPPA